MPDFLMFRKLYTPLLIQFLFWIGVGVCFVEGIVMVASGGTFRSAAGVINGILVLVVGPIVVRVLCELLVAVFGIHESLKGRGDL